jgi:hypothetical protein
MRGEKTWSAGPANHVLWNTSSIPVRVNAVHSFLHLSWAKFILNHRYSPDPQHFNRPVTLSAPALRPDQLIGTLRLAGLRWIRGRVVSGLRGEFFVLRFILMSKQPRTSSVDIKQTHFTGRARSLTFVHMRARSPLDSGLVFRSLARLFFILRFILMSKQPRSCFSTDPLRRARPLFVPILKINRLAGTPVRLGAGLQSLARMLVFFFPSFCLCVWGLKKRPTVLKS